MSLSPLDIHFVLATENIMDASEAIDTKFLLNASRQGHDAVSPWPHQPAALLAQVQHNMWVTNAREAVLSIITGGGKWVEIKITADSLYQHLLLTAEKKFWRCVESGEPPRLFGLAHSTVSVT
jgi:hypothetical protein